MQIARLGAVLLSLSVFACGDDGGGTKLVDGGIGNTDSAPKVCTALTSASLDVTSENLGNFIGFYSEITEQVGGNEIEVYVDFYHSVIPNLAGTFNLAEGDQASYAACGICIYAASFSADGTLDKFFFQKEGTVTFLEDPITARKLNMQISGLKLQEATITQGDQTFLPQGDCTSLSDGTLDTDYIPNAWTCDTTGEPSTYYSGATGECDCNCGAYDPDCRVVGATVNGCSTAGQACWPDADAVTTCVTAPLNDTCVSAEQLTVNAAAVSGTTVGAAGNYTQPNTNTCTMYSQGGREVVYKVTLAAGTAYTITLDGVTNEDHDPSLSLVGPDENDDEAECVDSLATCAAGTDAGIQMEGEAIAYTPTVGGTYYIIVDTYYQDSGGPFTIRVTQP